MLESKLCSTLLTLSYLPILPNCRFLFGDSCTVQAGAISNHIRTDHDHLTQYRRKASIKPIQDSEKNVLQS